MSLGEHHLTRQSRVSTKEAQCTGAQEGPGSVKAGGHPGAHLGRTDSGRGIAEPDQIRPDSRRVKQVKGRPRKADNSVKKLDCMKAGKIARGMIRFKVVRPMHKVARRTS